jgi:hypothetical protein
MTDDLIEKWENHNSSTEWCDIEDPKILILRYLRMKRVARDDYSGNDRGLIRKNLSTYGFSTSKQGLSNMLNNLVDSGLVREIDVNGQLNEYMFLWEDERKSSRDDEDFRKKMADALGGEI